jgi:prepilin-type N-terminal cleavage/methylation domain-containing protein
MVRRLPTSRRRLDAFTLIEMIAVVIVLGLIAIAASRPSDRGNGRMKFEAARDCVVECDRAARTYARRFDRELEVQVWERRGRIALGVDRVRRSRPSGARLPHGYVVELLLATGGSGRPSSSYVPLRYSPQGRTQSYAMRLTGPSEHDVAGWIVVDGLTGGVTEVATNADVTALIGASR